MLSRNIKKAPQQTKITAINTLVWPRVEYSAAIWDPYTQENIDKIERVQRRAARYVYNDYRNDSLNRLNWKPLQERRLNIRLCLFYKIVNRLVVVSTENYLVPQLRPSLHYNSMAYTIFNPRHDYYKYSFFPRTIVIAWNQLPVMTVKASTLKAFKTQIHA
jgi:hypothetical protein